MKRTILAMGGLGIMLLCTLWGNAQDTTQVFSNHQRQQHWEHKLEMANDAYKEALQAHAASREYMNYATSALDHFYLVTGVCAALLTLMFTAVGLSVTGYAKSARKKIDYARGTLEKEMREEFARLRDKNEELIHNMFESEELEQRLRQQSSLLILKYGSSKLTQAEDAVLRYFNYREKSIADEALHKPVYEDTLKNDPADVIILTGWNANEQKTALAEIANVVCPAKAIFFWGFGQFPTKDVDEDKQHMVSFGNAASQVYGNLLNLLKFQDKIRRSNIQ